MSAYQMPQQQIPYGQGLVPAIQQMQLQPVNQLGAYNPQMPNPAQDAYLKSLQDTIKNSQDTTAQGLKTYGDTAAKSGEKKKEDDGGGFWGFVKAAAPIALAMI